MFQAPVLTAAIAECYFNSRKKTVLPLGFLQLWVNSLGPGILYIDSSLFKQCIMPAWRRLRPSKTPAADYDEMLVRSSEQLRNDQPLSTAILNDPDLQSFIALKLPPASSIRYIVFGIELDNGTNWCILVDTNARSCELVSCVNTTMDPLVVEDISAAARWFTFYCAQRACPPRHIFKNTIPIYYCTVLSLYYTYNRIAMGLAMDRIGRVLSEIQMIEFLNSFCTRDALCSISQRKGRTDSFVALLEHLRNVSVCGKRRAKIDAQHLTAEQRKFLTEKLLLRVEASPTDSEKLIVSWNTV